MSEPDTEKSLTVPQSTIDESPSSETLPKSVDEGVAKAVPPQAPTFPDGGREAWIVSI